MSLTLLTLPDVAFTTPTTSEDGTLALELSTGSQEKEKETATLILRLNAHAHAVEPASVVTLVIAQDGRRTYSFDVGGEKNEKPQVVRVVVRPPTEDIAHVAQDIETFDHLLTQYADLSWSYDQAVVPPPLPARTSPAPPEHHANLKANVEEAKPVDDPALRGRLVLMDEASGEVVGELPQTLNIHEDLSVARNEKGSDAVVLEMHPDMYDACTGVRALGAEGEDLKEARDVIIRVVPPEERDWILKSATLIRYASQQPIGLLWANGLCSQAISGSTSLLCTGITSASNYYISHSQPGTPKSPTVPSRGPSPSPSTSPTALERVHTFSGKAAQASAKTADVVEGVIRRAMGGKPKVSSPQPAYATPLVYGGPPPPYAVYTPKPRPVPTPPVVLERLPSPEPEPGPPKPVTTKLKLLMGANLILTSVDDSARRMFEIGSDRLGAVVGHK